jgi:thioredoxin 1
MLDELKRKVGENATIIKVDVDKNPAAASAYGVQGVPTLILFKEGQPKWRQSGVIPVSQLEMVIRNYL